MDSLIILKDSNHFKYVIKSNKINYSNVKYVGFIGNKGIQFIDSVNNNVFIRFNYEVEKEWDSIEEFYRLKTKKINFETVSQYSDFVDKIGVCGAVSTYNLKLKVSEKFFIIQQQECEFGSEKCKSYKTIRKIDRKGISDIKFSNGLDNISYDYNIKNYNKNLTNIIYRKHNKYGILDKTEAIYDKISMKNDFVLIENDKKVNYFEISPIPKYLSIEKPNGLLVPVTFSNNQKGYVDLQGNEFKF